MPLAPTYDLFRVVLSLAIGLVASFLAFRLQRRPAGLALGLGAWGMHVVGVRALELPVAVHYQPLLLGLALVVAVIGASTALALAARRLPYLVLGGCVLGVSLTAMHHAGIAALRVPAMISYHPATVVLGFVVALAAGIGMLWLLVHPPGRWGGPAALGLALAGVHYTTLAAVTFTPSDVGMAPLQATLDVAELDGALVGVSTLFVLAIAMLGAQQARNRRSLAEANARLLEADRYKDEFLSVISHELRTPLNFILGFASILDDELAGTLNEEQHRQVGKIMAGSDRMLALVNDLLDFAKIQAGKLALTREVQLLAPLFEDAIGTLAPLAARKGVRLTAHVDVDVPLEVDGPRVIQVLTNLVTNAIKFTPAGGNVTVRAAMDGDRVLTQVIDTGVGIPPDQVVKLFARFQQLDMSATRQSGGTGLGLSIAKALVEGHRGEIGVLSEPGAGSTFWFTLPATVPARVEAG
ncbi:MAG: Sensory transduction histidine kinase [Cyanobacteria bacterium RYN_339]|nr:Sensory transduction histidine kinase [Cyanobacteria bacterium RYN_339]